MSKFKIGDKVKVIRTGSAPKETLGEVGKVISSESDNCIQVKFGKRFEYSSSWWYLAEDLTLVEEENEVPVKPEPKQTLDKYFVEDECFTQALKNYENQFTGGVDQSTFVVKESTVTTNEQGGIPVVNEKGGVKNFGGKPEPRLLFQSMPEAVMEVIKVLTYGSRKYSPDNWKLVDDFAYHDALQRHYLAKCTGEQNDPDTNLNHLAHMACSVLFLLQKEIDRKKED